MANQLSTSSSLYLRQHAGNPVHWQPWSDESLHQAASENKLIIVSIGYAACHWCHVMEHESFSDREVAATMNRDFVCIKVDREERPDVDQQYMTAVQLINGNGGWPLNCITLPDGKPVFGGTYFRRDDWVALLEKLAFLWRVEPETLRRYADELTQSVARFGEADPRVEGGSLSRVDWSNLLKGIIDQFDARNGGLKGAPKFPMPPLLGLLMKAGEHGLHRDATALALLTLRRMRQGGIFDHLAGGFARYSVDSNWRIPHFEKMLYDNAQLAGLYAIAYRMSGDTVFRDTALAVLRFLQLEIRGTPGGFMGSLDADTEGEEGAYYAWTFDEIQSILGDDAGIFNGYYNLKKEGNFVDGKNVLYALEEEPEYFEAIGLNKEEGALGLEKGRRILLAGRKKRTPPLKDPKCITSWNALLVSGLVEMARAFDDETLYATAAELMDDILKYAMNSDGTLNHLFGGQDAVIPGFLDDYAAFIVALTDLYAFGFEQRHLGVAIELSGKVLTLFSDEELVFFYYISSDQAYTVARKMELHDHVTPSSNALMALALRRLSFYAGQHTFAIRSDRMLGAMHNRMMEHPSSYGTWAMAELERYGSIVEVTLSGPGSADAARELRRMRWSRVLIKVMDDPEVADSDNLQEGLQIIVCRNQACFSPLYDLEEARKLIASLQKG